MFESTLLGAFRVSLDGYLLWANDTLARLFGFSSVLEMRKALVNKTQKVYVRISEMRRLRDRLLREGLLVDYEVQMRKRDGTIFWASESVHVVRDEAGTVLYYEGFIQDISHRKQTEMISSALVRISNAVSVTCNLHELFRTIHEVLKALLNADNFFIALLDHDTDTLKLAYLRDLHSDRFCDLRNISVMGNRSLSSRILKTGRPLLLSKKEQLELGRIGTPCESWIGVPLVIEGKNIGVMVVQDYVNPTAYNESHLQLMVSVSEQVAMAIQRKHNEEQLAYQATHDFLTGLPNRLLFSQRLDIALTQNARYKNSHFSVLLLDLDRFKLVNDSMGHQAGDELLRQASGRFVSCLREVDTIARFGGDEFAVLLEGTESTHDTLVIIDRLQTCLLEPFNIFGEEVHTTASIGVIINTRRYNLADEILRDADLAMYKAKGNLKAGFCVFDSSLHEEVVQTITMENAIRRGLKADEFHLVYQPIFDLEKTTLAGFEALLRWNAPDMGPVFPDQFIPVAEESGLIIELGAWALREACRTMASWIAQLPVAENVYMSVNISPRQFAKTTLPKQVRTALRDAGLKARNLRLEITESCIMRDAAVTQGTLRTLSRLGTGIAIDDFGTGYSSLSYLQRYPVDILKVDRSFISGMESDQEKSRLVTSIIALAHSMNMTVVAEGVETCDQAEILKTLGCELAQGFFFSKPVADQTALRFISLGALPPGAY